MNLFCSEFGGKRNSSSRTSSNAGHGATSRGTQRSPCKGCRKWFVVNLCLERMHAIPLVITSAMTLYITGESLGGVARFLKLQGVTFTQQSVWNWVSKYTKLIEDYLEQIRPQLSDTWRTDEM